MKLRLLTLGMALVLVGSAMGTGGTKAWDEAQNGFSGQGNVTDNYNDHQLLSQPPAGLLTNAATTAENQLRLEWSATTSYAYRVETTLEITEPIWIAAPPVELSFTDDKGVYLLPMNDSQGFCRVIPVATTSRYLVVDLSGGPLASNYPVSTMSDPPPGGWTDEYKTTKLVLRHIPAGTFMMGSLTIEPGMWNIYEPYHKVTLTKDFYIGVFQTTQKQWERVMGNWPSYFTNVTYRETRPVEQVAYDDVRGMVAGTNWPANGNVDEDSFMGRLRSRTGQTFDLPTDAQWEYACRAGTTTALNLGKDLTDIYQCPNMAEVGRYYHNGGSVYNSSVSTNGGTMQVGSYLPNAWGLYDMHGNVFESCLDWFEAEPAGELDPLGPASSWYRMLRGGGWIMDAFECRSAMRNGADASDRNEQYGFRVSIFPDL